MVRFLDINECKEGTHNCQQVCHNLIGSHYCGCKQGYKLNNDGKTCTGITSASLHSKKKYFLIKVCVKFAQNSNNLIYTAQKMKFIKDFFSKCDQIRSFLRSWWHFLKKSSMENFIFCALICRFSICFLEVGQLNSQFCLIPRTFVILINSLIYEVHWKLLR